MNNLAPTNKKFNTDRPEWTAAKNRGTVGELLVEAMLRALGFKVQRAPDDVAGLHDLRVGATVEVKTDSKAEVTGHIAVEVAHRGRPSGISTSTASSWCFVVGAVVYMMPTEKLRESVRTRYFRRVAAGESAECLLVPIATIRAIARVIPLGGEK